MFDVRVIPELSSMILTLLAVLILFWGLSKLLYKPVSKILNERKEKIQNDIDGAKVLKEEAATLKSEYESKLLDARKETQEIIESGRKRGEEIKEDIIAEAKKEAENIVEKAKREIQAEREKALLDVKMQAGEMAVLIASKIIEKDVDLASQQDLIEKFVDEVGTREWQN
ncbi:ATP synthase subunit b [[Clostridium] ultunense Esp]|uniref:ATP synthase subunit b n=1 Tax=[Clostridium] ultunense Esp TaxID=1288971 RepID=M1ZAK0_9FIRM|nr:F0F1 ATP synthase subunit B [Schnuerera ultunensis]CCQ94693.1 ATP synthase subunit b [[Clostridium] ultunense Esp]SHD76603.1 ATP synthase subunit b [[Clostridium] ultunense Esp]